MMRHATVLAMMLAAGGLSGTAQGQFSLAFADEFDGNSLNLNNWSPMFGTGCSFGICGWGNNELQYYTNRPENLQVSNGTLKIIARQESFAGSQYTSARIRSYQKQDFLYGRFEASLKLPSTTGIWPAFWMLATDSPYGGWAASGEIDIMESVNFADRLYTTIHYGGFFPENRSRGESIVPGQDLSQSFNLYAVEWSPDVLRWYLNDQLVLALPSTAWDSTQAPSNQRAPFDQPFHMLLNVAVGGNFPGNPNGSSVFPQTMEADFVRVYEWVQEPFGGQPAPIPGAIQAEDFDFGADSQAYVDADPARNNGGAYRPNTGVDIEARTGGGFNVGWIESGDRMEYTVNVAQAGDYSVSFSIASPAGGGSLRLTDGAGNSLTGDVTVPATGGWQSFAPIEASVSLEAGVQVIAFENAGPSGRFNFDSMEFGFTGENCGPADRTTSGSNPGDPGYSIPDGTVDASDLTYFVERWINAAPETNLTTSGANPGDPGYGVPDSSINASDLTYFIEFWVAGCP